MSLLYTIGVTVLVGTVGYIVYKWWTQEEKVHVHIPEQKPTVFNVRIRPELQKKMEEFPEKQFKMKLACRPENKAKMEQDMKSNGLVIRTQFDFGFGDAWIFADGTGAQFLKMLDHDYVLHMEKNLVYSIPERDGSRDNDD